jgi:adenosylhomocysteine nucleosidase
MKPLPPTQSIGGLRLMFVMAATPEYGPELKRRFEPVFTGVGPVEAACTTAAALGALHAEDALPHLLVALGSAGSATLEQGEIYQASRVSYRDIDASVLGFPKGTTPFLDLPRTIELPYSIPGVKSASLSTGAAVISGQAYEAIDADMVDMETFAVLRAAMRFSVPLIGLRGISDGDRELRHYDDWHQYLHVVDAKLAEAVDLLVEWILSGGLQSPL